MTTLLELHLPGNVASALQRLCADLQRAAGDNLAGVILYGGLARGRYRPGYSDANVVILLRRIDAAALDAITGPLRAAWRAIRAEPFLMTPEEVPAAARAFATKFLDIKDHHVVLAGEDAFATLDVPLEVLRQDVAESLRNLRFRLRQRHFRTGGDAEGLSRALAGFARPLALTAAALLRCAGKEFSAEDRSALIFEAAADAFGLESEPLRRLAELRHTVQAPADAAGLYGQVLTALDRLIQAVDQMKTA